MSVICVGSPAYTVQENEYARTLRFSDDKQEFYGLIAAMGTLEKSPDGRDKTIMPRPDSALAKRRISP